MRTTTRLAIAFVALAGAAGSVAYADEHYGGGGNCHLHNYPDRQWLCGNTGYGHRGSKCKRQCVGNACDANDLFGSIYYNHRVQWWCDRHHL